MVKVPAHTHVPMGLRTVRYGDVPLVFGDEGRFGSITRSAKLYSTTHAVSGAEVIRAEKEAGGKVGVFKGVSTKARLAW